MATRKVRTINFLFNAVQMMLAGPGVWSSASILYLAGGYSAWPVSLSRITLLELQRGGPGGYETHEFD
jgi:hypothetical protein